MAKNFKASPVTKTAGTDLINVRPTPAFFFMHNPNGWEMLETEEGGYEWLPRLKRFTLTPGVNGIAQDRRGGVDYRNAKSRFEQRGWTFIMPEDVPGGYMVEYEGRWGKVYADKWSHPRPLGAGDNAKILWDHDAEGFNDFRRSLVERLGPPDPSVIDFRETIQAKRVKRREREGHIPSVAAHIEKETAKLAAIKASKPKRKRKSRKAATL
jgi:hypothetical protein